jgi:hypothetical protein
MKIKLSLLKIMFMETLPVTLIALLISCIYVLFAQQILIWQNPWIAMFILVHSIAIAALTGRYRSRAFTFLYTRGYTKDELWFHKMLSTALSVLAVWLPASLIIWLSFRSFVQDKMFVSPYFPIMTIREAEVPWAWLAGYAILLPLFHYVWIRRAQPLRDENGVVFLAIGVVIVISTLMTFRWYQHWFKILVYTLSIVMIITCLVSGKILHRNIEVQ